MRFLVIGLGSMGKRRIRCLQALGHEVFGLDAREDRQAEALSKYGVRLMDPMAPAPDAWFISLPPDRHVQYIENAQRHGIPCFVEASVVLEGLEGCVGKGHVVPSATMLFHPAIKALKGVLASGRLGKVSNVLYHMGQYLPDWHTYEKPADYYVSNPKTGAAREMVAFELTWFTRLFGFPSTVHCDYGRTIEIAGAPISDTYNILFDYAGSLASITVDVVSRRATRRLVVNGSEAQLIWSWEDSFLEILKGKEIELVTFSQTDAAAGYNVNIGEGMYIEETQAFIDSLGGKPFPNTLEQDVQILKLLERLEA